MTFKCHYYLPPFVVILIQTLAFYAYIIGFCVYILNDVLISCLYILIFNSLFIMFTWSFLSAACTSVALVPTEYVLTDEELYRYERENEVNKDLLLQNILIRRNLVAYERTCNGYIRYCKVCNQIKPDRAHHCSTCGLCVLKMDHHCGWINNCVGFTNQKNFVLMLFYSTGFCIYFIGTTMDCFLLYLNTQDRKYIPVVLGFLTATFLGMITSIFGLFHFSLLFRNKTTLERLQAKTFTGTGEHPNYDLGCLRNFTEVFGTNCILWPCPIFSGKGDGVMFPVVEA
ncbi:hypothetical protein NQ317_015672 [Molorchus minor]|uniref:Palmitoyltransferase n=1 Tax=Molorchus minor TaxID=1323400 RepID=A0ABQ9J0C1_9CUCU|nr:hypothetical protein NQ317_015672 [Molorchus minor]